MTIEKRHFQDEYNPIPAYDFVIPGEIRINPNLTKDEKYFAGLLRALSKIKGYCWASNEYLAQQMEVSERTIQRYLKKLEENEVIHIEIYQNKNRYIWQQTAWILNEYQNEKKRGGRVTSETSRNPDSNVANPDSSVDLRHIYIHSNKNNSLRGSRERSYDPSPPPSLSSSSSKELSAELEEVGTVLEKHVRGLSPKHADKKISPSHLEKYIKPILKRYSVEEIRRLFEWLNNSNHKDALFWRMQVQGATKLREKIDKIYLAYEACSKPRGDNLKAKNREIALMAKAQLTKIGSKTAKLIFIAEDGLVNLETGERISWTLNTDEFENELLKSFKLTKS